MTAGAISLRQEACSGCRASAVDELPELQRSAWLRKLSQLRRLGLGSSSRSGAVLVLAAGR